MKKGFNDTRYRAVCGDRARTVVYVYPCMGYYLCVPPYTRYDGRGRACSTKTPYTIRRMMDVDSARVSATHARAALDELDGVRVVDVGDEFRRRERARRASSMRRRG